MAALTPELQSFDLLVEGLREISETVQLSEAVARILPERNISESLQLSEEVDLSFREVQESIQFTETVSAAIEVKTPVLLSFYLNSTAVDSTDSIILIESIELKYGTLDLPESILFSEDLEVARLVEISETIFQSESLSLGNAAILPEEFFFFAEEVRAEVNRSNQESVFFSEELSIRPCFIAEFVELGENVTREFPLPKIEETLSVSELILNEIQRLPDEGIGLEEEIESLIFRATSVSEVMNFVEQWEAKRNPTDETLKFTELAEAYKNLVEKEISETFDFSETIQFQIEQIISEAFNFSEGTSISFTGSIPISESIEFAEYVNRNRVTPSESLKLTEAIQERVTANLPDSLQISEIVDTSLTKHRELSDQLHFAEDLEQLYIWILEIEEDLNFSEILAKEINKHIGPDVPIEIQLFEDLVFSEVLERDIMIEPISEGLVISETIELPTQTRLITELVLLSEVVTADHEPAGTASARFRTGGKKKRFSHLRKGV